MSIIANPYEAKAVCQSKYSSTQVPAQSVANEPTTYPKVIPTTVNICWIDSHVA